MPPHHHPILVCLPWLGDFLLYDHEAGGGGEGGVMGMKKTGSSVLFSN